MKYDATTYYVWIGGSCDYAHEERAGAAAVVIERAGCVVHREAISGLHTTEFRMMLSLMAKVMDGLPECSDLLFLTNVAYLQNFDRPPTPRSANPDLLQQCIAARRRHRSVSVRIVPYHKHPRLVETHHASGEAMKAVREAHRSGLACR